MKTPGNKHTAVKPGKTNHQADNSKTGKLNKNSYIRLGILFAAILGIYMLNLNNGFVKWDDDWYIIENTQIKNFSVEKTGELFAQYYKGQYSPLSTLAIALLHNDTDPDPGAYHAFSIFIHIINTALVFWLLMLLFGRFEMAFLVAALFGLHTLQVEAFAWASALKVLMYTTFFISSLISYVKYIISGKYRFIFLSFLLFILSFFSKEQAVTLSVSIIAIDFLMGRNLTERKVILEKVPFVILSVLMGIVTIFSSRTGEFYDTGNALPFYKQLAYAGYAFVHYIIKLILPVKLSAFYPYPENRVNVPVLYWFAIIPALVALAYFIRSLKKNKVIAFATAFFFINILLVMQLMPLRDFVAADRFVYIPSIGFFIIIAWTYNKYYEEKKKMQIPLKIFTFSYLVLLFILSQSRMHAWKDSVSLFDDMVKKVPESSVAWNNRGLAFFDLKKYPQAVSDFHRSIEINPSSVFAYNNLGIAYTKSGDIKNAVKALNTAIKLRPDFLQAYYNRADAKTQLNDLPAVISDYTRILDLRPEYAEVYNLRGVAIAKTGKMKEAIIDLNKAIEIDPGYSEAFMNRGVVRLNLSDYDGAIKDFTITIKMKPGFAYPYFNRGLAYIRSGMLDAGCNDLKYARQLGFSQANGALKQFCEKY